MNLRHFWWLLAVPVLVGIVWGKRSEAPVRARPPLTLSAAIQQLDDHGFAPVDAPWRFQFPRDHGGHPDYRTESWQFAGHFKNAEGEDFACQLAFFRLALVPATAPMRSSAWGARGIFRGQLTVVDFTRKRFHAQERLSREALGLTGTGPSRVWIEDWNMEAKTRPGGVHEFDLRARSNKVGLELNLRSVKPAITQGADSGSTAGFYAYVLSRLAARGVLRIGDRRYAVRGLAWLDRAWGLVPVPDGPVVWDRFLIQLDDGREITAFRLRRRDGSGKPIVRMALIGHDAKLWNLDQSELSVQPQSYWKSPGDGAPYPLRWRLSLPAQGIRLDLAPLMEEQEIDLSLRYWGGTVRINGEVQGQPVAGTGYAELTGYAPRDTL
ncbi:MAG: lipocalin family protein [Gammaproteobacteria bacterium]